MTTTVTTELRSSHSNQIRRNAITLFAAAAIIASTAFVVSETLDNDSARVGARPNESTLGVTEMWGAVHAAFIPPAVNQTVPDAPHGQLVINEAMSDLCALGHQSACPFAHTWVPVNPLPGLGDVVAGLPAHPLQGMGEMVVGLGQVVPQ